MPSLAQGYGKGLLLGLQLEEAKRQKQRDELSDEFLKERLEDMRFQRKTLMSQLKREEEERKEAGLEKVAKGHRMAETGVGLRDLLSGAGISVPQAQLAETEYYETEKIPSYAAEWLTPPKPKEKKEPKVLTESQVRATIGQKFMTGEWTPQTHPTQWEYLRKPTKQDPLQYFLATGQWPAEMGGQSPVIPELAGGGEMPPTKPPQETETTFYGANSYEEVEETVKDLPEAERNRILAQARKFFGIE